VIVALKVPSTSSKIELWLTAILEMGDGIGPVTFLRDVDSCRPGVPFTEEALLLLARDPRRLSTSDMEGRLSGVAMEGVREYVLVGGRFIVPSLLLRCPSDPVLVFGRANAAPKAAFSSGAVPV
jgi:hypothetical protein